MLGVTAGGGNERSAGSFYRVEFAISITSIGRKSGEFSFNPIQNLVTYLYRL